MQREYIRRGYSISHQKVVLEIDFSGSAWGYTEITVVPNTKDLKTIHLHSRQCYIHSVTVAAHQADFIHQDPLSSLSISDPRDVHNHPELKRKVYSALAEGDEGELSIAIPAQVRLSKSGSSINGGLASEVGTPEPQTPGPSSQTANTGLAEYSPITIKIVYSLRNASDGLQFVIPSDAYPFRVPHVYTSPTSPDAARCWVPCVDNLWEKCTWDFEFVVPKYLEEKAADTEDEGQEGQQGEYPTVVVCSGDLVEQVAHPYNSNKTIFLFSQTVLTSVQHIAWATGPFHVHTIPADHSAQDDPSGVAQPLMHAFCLPGYESHLLSSVSFIRVAMSFYTTEFGSYPFGSYKMVFVDDIPQPRFDSATLSLITVDLLHGDDAIDQVYETRHSLSHALACQWVGINIHQKTWSDTWLVNGLGLYICGLFLRKLFGNNEYRFRLKKDCERVLEYDNGSQPPICQPYNPDPPDSSMLPFVNLKSPLVLHILDRRLCKSGTSLGLSRVLPKLFLSAISGEMPANALSTHSFLRMCRKVSGMDPRTFADQWIYGSGCPSFGFSASFNRKKMAVEISMRQEAPAYAACEGNEVMKTLMKPVPFFEGQMTIRIHEADGTPYEHVLDIRSTFKRYEVPFNTKYKRVRRNTKRYLARQAAAQAAAEGDAEAVEAMGLIDMGFGLEIWEKENERENWRVVDWTEEDEAQMSGATYEWIRIDADFEWIAGIAFEQPDFMWVSQLQRDRDVVAQLEAVHALARQPTAVVSSMLTRTVLVSNYFFRIRAEAAMALVTCAVSKLNFLGLWHLFKLFLRYCYEPEDSKQDLFQYTYVPKPNDFSDLAEYFVRKSILNAVARVRLDDGKTPAVIRKFLIDQLRYNDNTANPYHDAFYICNIIAALASATVSVLPPERGELLQTESKDYSDEDIRLMKDAVAEVDRYRSMDRLIPSPHNVVTVAAVEFYVMLAMANLIPNDARVFFPLTREGNGTQVRIAAFDALFLTKWYTPKVMAYILSVMAHDSCRVIRRHVAKNTVQSLALLVSMGEMKTSLKETESLLIEEDGATAEKVKEGTRKSEVDIMMKALRKDREVGKNEAIREYLMPLILAPDADHEVRWCLLKLADLLVRGAEESAPKVTIHLPPTPVLEQPPPLPLPKASVLKSQRTIKAIGGTPKMPMPPHLIIPSTKLLFSPSTPAMESPKVTNGAVNGQRPIFAKPAAPKGKKAVTMAPKKGGNAPKAQAAGMSVNDLRACRNALQKLRAYKHAPLFLQPVDPVRDRAPNYFDIIKNPMDLSTMGAKLEAGQYHDRFAFEADFRLMITNAKTYNLQGSYAYNEAAAMESFFDKQWVRINKTLEAADKAHQEPPPPPKVPEPAAVSPVTPAPVDLPAVPAATPRPTIKLKVGNASTTKVDGEPLTPAPAPKAKSRKSKVSAAPAAPDHDVDDDLLEEVIAIEREKAQPTPKRKHRVDDKEEDELLALAIPEKKQRSSPTEEMPLEKRKEKPKNVGTKLTLSVKNAKKTAPPPVPVEASPLKLNIKGKEKEREREQEKPKEKPKEVAPASSPAPAPATPKPSKEKKASSTPSQTTPLNEKKCREILRTLLKMPESAIFARPVDPVLDGCPTYYDEIESPMDLQTMGTKLGQGKYGTIEEFVRDTELIFSNCRKFNPPTTYPVNCADVVEKAFKREWAKMMEKKLSWQEKRSLQSLMTKLVAEDISWVFREPVDPEKLGVPTYFDVIPRHTARDLKTIRQKLDADKYDSVEAFEADLDLMVRNAITFNGADSEVGNLAVVMKNRYRELLANVKHQQAKKRKETDSKGGSATPQPTSKKARMH
ncbi:hypothetical protein NEOLEDRAFT_1130581 [Neolentinus lepideus HHB14362 ss-1]|uniref:Transcription initiation factor TFIID subunit 2 n=1 Tax=Neolentinus lepideus HHB14362 ss-1 TaxID=1314782 RepID=A0A165U3E0_9AGAM|nr:hypothetical protein NEOLEDRAFT_1130581 [Neolentinus lepideus HHB14362 ss-1]